MEEAYSVLENFFILLKTVVLKKILPWAFIKAVEELVAFFQSHPEIKKEFEDFQSK